MSLMTRRAPAPADESHAIDADESDPREYVIGISFPSGNGIAGLTHSSLMTRGEAMFELEKWQRADTRRNFMMLRITAV